MSTQSANPAISSAKKSPSSALGRLRMRLDSWIDAVDDRINPIVIKELRQAVQGKFLNIVLMVFLLGQLVALGINLMQPGVQGASWFTARAGRDYFLLLMMILLGTCLLFIPLYTGARLAFERSDQNVDLIFVSTLPPSSVIAGKFFSALFFTVLIYSACAPFMAVSYMLRGIDMISIFVLLGFAFFVVMLSIMMAIFAACITTSRFFRFLIGGAVIGALCLAFAGVFGVSQQALRRGIGSAVKKSEFWIGATMILTLGFFALGLMYRLSVAMITPASNNRALPVRIYYTVGWAVSGIIFVLVSIHETTYELLNLWQGFHVMLLSAAFFLVITEREQIGYRLARSLPQGELARYLRFPFYSGAAGGILWVLGLAIPTLCAPWLVEIMGISQGWRQAGFQDDRGLVFTGLVLYGFAYSTTGLLIHRVFLRDRLPKANLWVLPLLIFVICGMVPFFLTLMFNSWHSVREGCLIATPLVLGERRYQKDSLSIAAVWSGIVALAYLPILLDSLIKFRAPMMLDGMESALRIDRKGG